MWLGCQFFNKLLRKQGCIIKMTFNLKGSFIICVFTYPAALHLTTMPPSSLSTAFIVNLTILCCISGILAILLAVRSIHSLRSTARYFMTSLTATELLSPHSLTTSSMPWIILETKASSWKQKRHVVFYYSICNL